jgi:hypothetical protein
VLMPPLSISEDELRMLATVASQAIDAATTAGLG